MRGDELGFARVPSLEDFLGGCATQDTRMNETCETDARNVPGRAEDAFKVPDGFGAEDKLRMLVWFPVILQKNCLRLRVDFVEEATTVFSREDTGESPRLLLKRLHILNLD